MFRRRIGSAIPTRAHRLQSGAVECVLKIACIYLAFAFAPGSNPDIQIFKDTSKQQARRDLASDATVSSVSVFRISVFRNSCRLDNCLPFRPWRVTSKTTFTPSAPCDLIRVLARYILCIGLLYVSLLSLAIVI